ncbi:DUF2877 domain-containing protein [Leekyejoonella antrihumi]|uniref:DUF2877 domain-containing protein n=1 Tax=Leekyejoonella antrihumi TaxID=1660198 RepID=A0A563E6G3_9MICO|nr:DUF2877 domain-containing protein [Leekyejoonella antrihumi]TWP38025.1 DUF2877 domain-containing protein [Leekyejoonella antrihumi]
MAALVEVTSTGTGRSCPVIAVSRPVWRLLAEHSRLRVHSVFSTAVNLRCGKRLVTCTSGGVRAPHGVDLTSAGLDRLRRVGGAGNEVEFRGQPGETSAKRPPPDGSAGPLIYDPNVPVIPLEVARPAARRLLSQLARTRPATGFGTVWPDLSHDPALISVASSVRRGKVDAAVVDCLGRGPGLTPSGDDFLVGVLAALWAVQAVDVVRMGDLAPMLETAARNRTTDISVEYLHYACSGMATGALRAVLAALGHGDFAAVIDAVDRLRRFGHTSGMDALLGVVVALTT